jgi:hypothetical protein
MKSPGQVPGNVAAQMSTRLDPLRDGLLRNAAFAIAERAHFFTGITPNALAKLLSPKRPAFFHRLGVDICCLTIPLFIIDLWLFDRIAHYNVTFLRFVLLTHGTLMQQRVSLAGASDAYKHNVLALHYILAKEHVYGPKVATFNNDSDFTHTTHSVFGQIDGKVPKTTVIEYKTFGILGLANELRM